MNIPLFPVPLDSKHVIQPLLSQRLLGSAFSSCMFGRHRNISPRTPVTPISIYFPPSRTKLLFSEIGSWLLNQTTVQMPETKRKFLLRAWFYLQPRRTSVRHIDYLSISHIDIQAHSAYSNKICRYTFAK
jgi:hypothetical protein